MLDQHPEQNNLVMIILFESDLIWSNQIMQRKRATRMADNVNEIEREITVKGRFSKTPAK